MTKVKAISIIAAAAMMLAMVGCGSNSNSESSKTETSSAATTEATTEESTEETSEESTESATTTATESNDSNDADSTSESSAQTDTAMGSGMTITDVDSFFASLNGKTLDETKAYIESAFPVGECEESANAYTIPDENGNAMPIDLYTWHFSSEKTIEGVAFDYVSIGATNGTLFDAAFGKENSDKTTYSLLNKKIETYGYSTAPDSDNLYTMDCGTVHVFFSSSSGTIIISHEYQ